MPLEIKELHIKAVVNAPSAAGEGNAPPRQDQGPVERERLIRECVSKVLEVLKEKEER